MIFTKEIAQKVLNTVDAGLVSGIGNPTPGQMCVEAAVCYALDLPHGDNPPCVGSAVRSLKIKLNDSKWSSSVTRAKGLRRLAIAQLGSDTIDQVEFARRIVIMSCNTILADMISKTDEKIGKLCKEVDTLEKVKIAADSVHAVAINAANAAANAATANAYASVAYAAAVNVRAATANTASANAVAYAAAVVYTASYVASYGVSDKILSDYGEEVVQILIDMKSPGAEWLYLT